ncbi:MAG: TRAP transporter small permease [Hyphomonadaceae bacterium]|jgi:TRAP-type C4-dicarboxylate transport system permease small subunit|nr:TRAP transporter small permease [Hyphomonadaceae bacterium]
MIPGDGTVVSAMTSMNSQVAIRDGGGALGAADRAMHAIERFTALVAGCGIFGLMLIGVAQIFGRKLFNTPIFGYIDIVEIAMSALVFLGLAYTERLGGHIRMELFVSYLRGRWLWMFELIGVLIGLFIVAVLIFYSYQHAMRAYYSGDSSIDAQLLLWPSKLIVSVSLALLFLRLLVSLWGYLRLLAEPTAAPVGVPETIDVEEQALRDAQTAGIDVAPAPSADRGR